MMKTLTTDEKALIQKELKRFESKRSAILPALFIVQKERGWIPDETVEDLAFEMQLPASDIFEVRSFYTMFNEKPVGKLHVQVCANLSCSMNGGRQLAQKICETYKTKFGEVSPCGKVTVDKVECLGACDKAPMMQVNDRYHEDLTVDSALTILEELEPKSAD
jgi:NADH-quinone oxidoreductase subunit E